MIESLEGLKAEVDKLASLKERKRVYEEHASKVQVEIDTAEGQILEAMQRCDMEHFEGSKHRVHISTRTSVKFPQGANDREAFVTWLHSKGMEHLLTVNANTLVSMYNKETEAALARGEGGFTIPGIKDVKTYNKIGIRAK